MGPATPSDLVSLCVNLDGASALASVIAAAAADPADPLAFALHGLSEAEATGLATILDRLRA